MTELFHYLEKSVSPYHTVITAEERLKDAGFECLDYKNRWDLKKGGKYYVKQYGSTLVAFTLGKAITDRLPLRMAAAHTDFPGLCIKPNPDVKGDCYAQVNVEVYGGPILGTWLDRPLSAAGKVAVKSDDILSPKMMYIDLKKPVFTIPNLALHMNREVNKGVELNCQKHMLPIFSCQSVGKKASAEDSFCSKKEGKELAFVDYLAEEMKVKPEDILDYNLYLYCAENPQYVGVDDSMISSPRLDNITSVYAVIESLIDSGTETGHINVAAIFDHEEIGSRSKQGAGSLFFRQMLEKMLGSFSETKDQVVEIMADAMLVSSDVAHGLHPNYTEKADITNRPVLGGGFCIKEACSQSYATDSEAIGIALQICQSEGILCQRFANRSDMAGGGTIGSIASALVPVPTVDVGIPILAMHSARECMGSGDEKSLYDFLRAFFVQGN